MRHIVATFWSGRDLCRARGAARERRRTERAPVRAEHRFGAIIPGPTARLRARATPPCELTRANGGGGYGKGGAYRAEA